MLNAPNSRLPLAVCVAIFFAAALFGLATGGRLRYPDEKDYHDLALSLLNHHAFLNTQLQPTAARPPGYPWLLAGVYSLWKHPLAAKMLNAFACGFTALLLSRLSSANAVSSLAAPVLALCYPLFLYTASTLYPQTVGTLMFVGCIFLLARPCGWGWSALAGALYGFLILTIPSFLLWSPLFPVFLWLADRPQPGVPSAENGSPALLQRCRRAAAFAACMGLVMVPWGLRNYVQMGSFVPVSTNGGINLLLGNSPHTGPNTGVNVDLSDYLPRAEHLSEIEQDRFFKQCAVAYIRERPMAAFKLYLAKVVNYFNFRSQLYVASEGSRFRDFVLFATYYPLLGLALLRLCASWRHRLTLTECFFYVLYFGNAFVSAIFFTRIRFRIPFDALLIVLAAGFLGRVWKGNLPQSLRRWSKMIGWQAEGTASPAQAKRLVSPAQ